ncbi:MAG: hypothetical protein JSW14_04195 [Candidatus Bathyarchaeum sp.]|nr:MAG: hypothetical protein JSW14_04195 [Candidatus Bathyarchaeum sp.]
MKRAILITLCLIALCSIGLLATGGTIMAGNPDYAIIEYTGGITLATVDGVWTTPDEWNDGLPVPISDTVTFWYYAEITVYSCEFCVEIYDDDTNDTGDYWQFCFDDTESGGTAPQVGDYRVDIVGHTTAVIYTGDGSAWVETQQTPADVGMTWANSISASPTNSTPHWILEFTFIKTVAMIPSAPPTGLRVAVYDESNSAAGVQDWAPDSDVNVPDEWGRISGFSQDPVPEGLTFAVMVLLSSVSVLVGSHYLWKRSKKREK